MGRKSERDGERCKEMWAEWKRGEKWGKAEKEEKDREAKKELELPMVTSQALEWEEADRGREWNGMRGWRFARVFGEREPELKLNRNESSHSAATFSFALSSSRARSKESVELSGWVTERQWLGLVSCRLEKFDCWVAEHPSAQSKSATASS